MGWWKWEEERLRRILSGEVPDVSRLQNCDHHDNMDRQRKSSGLGSLGRYRFRSYFDILTQKLFSK